MLLCIQYTRRQHDCLKFNEDKSENPDRFILYCEHLCVLKLEVTELDRTPEPSESDCSTEGLARYST